MFHFTGKIKYSREICKGVYNDSYFIYYIKLLVTSPKASPPSTQDLSPIESFVEHLHTRNSSSEIPSISDTSSHSHGVVSSQSKSTHVPIGREPIIDKQLGSPGPLVISTTNKLPTSRLHCSARHVSAGTASSTFYESCKQDSRCNHPEVYAPAVRHVVEDGSSSSLVEDPRTEGDGISCVQPSSIWELDVAV